jgi:diacylglycerol kinase (ATP)
VRRVTRPARIVAIVNPAAGGGRAKRRWLASESRMRERWPGLHIEPTVGPGHATVLARRALEDGVGLVVAVGGDGTANEVLCGFMDGDGRNRFPTAELGLLGGGTGGDFLRQLGSPPWTAQLDALDHPARAIDYGLMRFGGHDGATRVRPFLNAASAGLTGHVVARVLRAGRASRLLLGRKGIYLWNSVLEILAYRSRAVEVQVDGAEPHRLQLSLAAVTNGQFFGGGMWVAPMAALDDGRLELLYTGDISTVRLLGLLPKIFRGGHVGHPKIVARGIRRVHLRPLVEGDEVLVELDGEQPGRLPAELWIVPHGLRVRVAGLPAPAALEPVAPAHGAGEAASSSSV